MTLEVVLHSSWPLESSSGEEPKKDLSQTTTILTAAKLKSREEIEEEADEEGVLEFSFQ